MEGQTIFFDEGFVCTAMRAMGLTNARKSMKSA